MAATMVGKEALTRVTSYNVLAQCYVRSSLFTHSPSSCLKCV